MIFFRARARNGTGRSIGRELALAASVLLAADATCAGQEPPFWGGLEPGPLEVGFRTEWLLDWGRTYRSTFEDGTAYGTEKAARPLLLNIWYPASPAPSASRMRHGDYLRVGPGDARIALFAAALGRYNLDVVAEEVTGRGPEELDDRTRGLFEAALAAVTASHRDAPLAEGTFPVVIYHAGHGSSYEDNAVLCELLASHGYVVIGSAFQYGDGSGLGTDTGAASIADVDALIRFTRGVEGADWSRIALVGHSGGAQLALRYAARPGSAVDAVVSLDTTQDYYGLSATFWTYPEAVLEDREYVTAPLLLAANPHAVFLLADSLSATDRYYVTAPGLAHNEFISQGLMASDFEARVGAGEGTAVPPRPAVLEYRGDPDVMATYRALVTTVRGFLDGHLKGDSLALERLRSRVESGSMVGPAPGVEYVPRGTTSAPPYSETTGVAPSPRQVRPLLERAGIEATIRILGRWTDADSSSPVLGEPTFATALLWESVAADRIDEARRLYRFFAQVHEDLIGEFLRWYDRFTLIGDEITAREWLDLAEALDPDHPEVRARSSPIRS